MVDAVKIVFLKFLDVKQIYITNHIKTPLHDYGIYLFNKSETYL